VFLAIGRPLGLRAIELDELWAQRESRIVVRDEKGLSPVTQSLFDHLATAEDRASVRV
jgi:hypothetical protein